jgi:hypothetical protein
MNNVAAAPAGTVIEADAVGSSTYDVDDVTVASAPVTEAKATVAPEPAGPAGPGGPGGPVGPADPLGPAGIWPRLKSALTSERFFTFAEVTAFFLS